MADRKIIQFPFHIGDFLGGVMHMDGVEVGAYTMMLVAHYQAGSKGIPDDDKLLCRISKVTPRQWAAIKSTVLAKFKLVGGHWVNEKVISVLLSIEDRKTIARTNSLKRWDAQDAKALPQTSYPLTLSLEPSVIKKESKSEAAASPRKKACRLTEASELPPEDRKWAYGQGLTQKQTDEQFQMMKRWSMSSPNGAKLDWSAAFKNWIMRFLKDNPDIAKKAAEEKRAIEGKEFMRKQKEGLL